MPLFSSNPVDPPVSSSGGTPLQRLEALHRSYYNALLAYGNAITGRRDWTKDAIQDLFLWLLADPERLENITNIEAYLFTALRRNLRGKLKTTAMIRPLAGETAELDEMVYLQVSAVDHELIDREQRENRRELLTREIDQLPDRLREAIYLRYFTQLSYREIAGVMSINPQVAKNFVSRAMKKLRSRINKHKLLLISIFFLFVCFS